MCYKYIMIKKTKKNRGKKGKKSLKPRHFKRKVKRKTYKKRKRRGGVSIEDFVITIPNTILQRLKILQVEGQQTNFQQYGKNMIGNERGGHFCYKVNIDKRSIDITGYKLAPTLLGCTSCNTGDYPFTFHTHPVVLIADTGEIDNEPNLISDEDLKGIIADSIWNVIGTRDYRQICGENPSQATVHASGVNIFDILAVPCGIYIYGLNPDKKPYPTETVINGENEEESEQFVTPSEVINIDSYANCPKIKEYQEKLEDLGFFLYYKSWADIERGEDMSVPIKFDTTSRNLSSLKCGNGSIC